MRMRELLLISLVVSVMVGLIVIYTRPSTTSYSVVNYGETGLSKLKETYRALVITDLGMARNTNPLNTTYLVIRLSNISSNDAEILAELVNDGGHVIVSGSPELIESLSRYMKLNLTLTTTGSIIYDMIHNVGDRFHPLGFSDYCSTTFVTYKPYYVLLNKAEVIAYSSNFSYADVNNNGYMDLEEPLGSFPLVALVNFSKGRLILVFSPHVFTNELFEFNKYFISCIVDHRELVIDQSEIREDFIEYLKIVISTRGVSYPMLIFLVFMLCMVAYYALKEK